MIAVALSGGVDSSVAALRTLEEKGSKNMVAIHLHLWDQKGEEASTSCCTPESTRVARQTADILGIPFYTFSMTELFRNKVVDPFVRGYSEGRTPNPCVACNRSVKFGALMAAAARLGAGHLATGHYAQTGEKRIFRAAERARDQSYFLYGIPLAMRGRISFPTGDLEKDSVRQLAREKGLPSSDRPDSQEVCFVPKSGYRAFLEGERVAATPGKIVSTQGRVLGTHNGIHRFTRGQRRHVPSRDGRRLYVLDVNPASGQIQVGSEEALWDSDFQVRDLRGWNLPALTQTGLSVKVRARGEEVSCKVSWLGERRLEVHLDRPLRAVTLGQSAVFYRGEELLGGGIIEKLRHD